MNCLQAGYRQPQQKPGLNVATTQAAKRSLWRAQHALVIIAGVLTSIVHCLDVALDAVVVQVSLFGVAGASCDWVPDIKCNSPCAVRCRHCL
jgi:hypothetical protein